MEIPFIHLNGIVCFGNILVSPGVITRFAEENRPIVWHDSIGRFKGRLVGPTSGNVLLRKAQIRAIEQKDLKFNLVRNLVAGKIRNSRLVIQRGAREAVMDDERQALDSVAKKLAHALDRLKPERNKLEAGADFLRGIEGNAARDYFSVFDHLIRNEKEFFRFDKRTRRPPRDAVNALLSFLYTLLLNDYVGAVEGIGLDPQFGFLHEIRPGRPSLALDLMEELRAPLIDRLVLSLINRQQVKSQDFHERPGGAVQMTDKTRKKVIIAYQERKQDTRLHPIVNQNIAIGMIPHIQARLLARYLRGDTDQYLPYLFR